MTAPTHDGGHSGPGITQQFATFRVADMFMGIELSSVQELMRYQEMASVPLAPLAIEGLINLRGQIVTAFDMRRILGLPRMENSEILPMNIIVRSDDGTVSILVDEICDVLDVSTDAATQPPENLPANRRALLKAVYQLESCLLLVLNTERVVSDGAD